MKRIIVRLLCLILPLCCLLASGCAEQSGPQVGDEVYLGAYYYYDGSASFAPVKWIVLERKDNQVLLLSKYIVDQAPAINITKDENGFIYTPALGDWLDRFYQTAFTDEEREMTGKPFILNRSQAEQLPQEVLTAEATPYVKLIGKNIKAWWLDSGFRPQRYVYDASCFHTELCHDAVNQKGKIANDNYAGRVHGDPEFKAGNYKTTLDTLDIKYLKDYERVAYYDGSCSATSYNQGMRPAIWVTLPAE